MKSEMDIVYALELLKKMNSLTIRGVPLDQFFNSISASAWSTKQFFLLSQIKEYSQFKQFDAFLQARRTRDSQKSFFGIFVSRCFILFSSFVAACILILGRVSVVTFEADRVREGTRFSPRLFRVFEICSAKHVRYVEFVHATSGISLIRNAFKRRRFVFYLEAMDVLHSAYRFVKKIDMPDMKSDIDFGSCTEDERRFIEYLLNKTIIAIYESEWRVASLTYVLRHSSVRDFVSIDDFRYMHEIIEACGRVGVTSHIFQHSNFDYLMGLDTLPAATYPFPDTFYVWNTYWLGRIPAISPLFEYYKERLAIGARTYVFEDVESLEGVSVVDGDTLSVLIPYEISLTAAQVSPYINALISEPRIQVTIQLRGDVDREEQIAKYTNGGECDSSKIRFSTQREKTESFLNAHVVLGVYSGFLDESLEVCRPVGVLECGYPIVNPLVPQGLADSVSLDTSSIYKTLITIAQTPRHELERRRAYVRKGGGNLEEVLTRILRKESDIVR